MLDRLNGFISVSKSRGLYSAIAASIVIVAVALGCQITTTSPFSGEEVTESALAVEYEDAVAQVKLEAVALQAKAESIERRYQAASADIAEAKARLSAVLAVVQEVAVGASGPYAPLAATVFGLLSIGLGFDNFRKDGLINGQKMALKKSPEATVT